MALTKVTKVGITNDAVDSDKLKDGSITTAKIGASAIESSEINDGTITVDDLVSTLDVSSKTVTLPNTSVTAGMLSNTLDLSSKTVTLSGSTVAALKQPIQDNIGLLGFKMAVNDGLTVFNLVDGVVDEFHDESGTDEAEGSNDLYCGTSDFYINSPSPTGTIAGGCFSAGFTTTSITEPDTSSAGTNPAAGEGTLGSFTVPAAVTTIDIKMWGSGGGVGGHFNTSGLGGGGGGGFVSGDLAVTASQVLYVGVAEGGSGGGDANPYNPEGGVFGLHPQDPAGERGGGSADGGGKGGGAGIIINQANVSEPTAVTVPGVYMAVGSGGGGGADGGPLGQEQGGAGGGLTGQSGVGPKGGPGGSQSAGGTATVPGGFLYGGNGGGGGGAGGGGYYGGGGAGGSGGSGAGGSSYYGHPQITCGATEGGSNNSGGGTTDPNYVPGTNEAGGPAPGPSTGSPGEDGYVLITTTSGPSPAPTTATTITSEAFASGTVATSSRIVVFEENMDTPTLNTDIIASVSRDAGVTFTAATLADSGYVTGSSGQRILTGQADISGQPSGQSMRWKLALANNKVKIHGVSLQWS